MQTRLTGGTVLFLEILLMIVAFVFYNIFGDKKPFHNFDKVFQRIFIAIVGICVIGFITFAILANSSPNQSPTAQQVTTFPVENLQIISNESTGNNYYNNPTYKLVIKNTSDTYTASNIQLRFTYSKEKDGEVLDTRDTVITDDIGPGETKTESVLINTPFDTVSSYWWRVAVVSANIK